MELKRFFKAIELGRQAFGGYKNKIILLTVLSGFGGLFEALGINSLVPLLTLISGTNAQSNDTITTMIVALLSFFHLNLSLRPLLLIISTLFIIKSIVIFICNYITYKIVADFEKNTRNKLFKSNIAADWNYLQHQKLGHLDNTLIREVGYSTSMLQDISELLVLFVSLVMYIIIALSISFNITLIVLALGGLIFLLTKPLLYRTRMMAKATATLNRQVAHFVSEHVWGMKTVKIMDVVKQVVNIGQGYFNKYRELRIKALLYKNLSVSFTQPVSVIFICIVLGMAYKAGNFNFASVLAVMYLVQRIFSYIQMVQTSIYKIIEVAPYLQNVLSYQNNSGLHLESDNGTKEFRLNRGIRFYNIDFSYQPVRPVLNGLDFEIKIGEMVGLIGPSGAGKTTIVDLLLRLFVPESGKIFLDGVNIQDISLKEWRKNIGYVSQDIFILNDTIGNNIRFYDENILDADIIEAAKMANIYDFIQQLPDKLNANVGERGTSLSVGQRQRIIIARILARKPKLLILDEATSSLDNESEYQIQKVIEGLKGKITILIIAHRLSTVMNCDKLVILNNGKIEEEGSPDKLLKNSNSYLFKNANIRGL